MSNKKGPEAPDDSLDALAEAFDEMGEDVDTGDEDDASLDQDSPYAPITGDVARLLVDDLPPLGPPVFEADSLLVTQQTSAAVSATLPPLPDPFASAGVIDDDLYDPDSPAAATISGNPFHAAATLPPFIEGDTFIGHGFEHVLKVAEECLDSVKGNAPLIVQVGRFIEEAIKKINVLFEEGYLVFPEEEDPKFSEGTMAVEGFIEGFLKTLENGLELSHPKAVPLMDLLRTMMYMPLPLSLGNRRLSSRISKFMKVTHNDGKVLFKGKRALVSNDPEMEDWEDDPSTTGEWQRVGASIEEVVVRAPSQPLTMLMGARTESADADVSANQTAVAQIDEVLANGSLEEYLLRDQELPAPISAETTPVEGLDSGEDLFAFGVDEEEPEGNGNKDDVFELPGELPYPGVLIKSPSPWGGRAVNIALLAIGLSVGWVLKGAIESKTGYQEDKPAAPLLASAGPIDAGITGTRDAFSKIVIPDASTSIDDAGADDAATIAPSQDAGVLDLAADTAVEAAQEILLKMNYRARSRRNAIKEWAKDGIEVISFDFDQSLNAYRLVVRSAGKIFQGKMPFKGAKGFTIKLSPKLD